MVEEKSLMDECLGDAVEMAEKHQPRIGIISPDTIADMAITMFKARRWKK